MGRDKGVSDTYSRARGSSGAGFSIFARKTLRGGRINGDEARGHTRKMNDSEYHLKQQK